ncbi:hypothetical protein [Oscillatoria sp. HE19RPO]|uniref:hypothetical protein n=1 Tax=Oscillatoria sp. HE19RPO TaxID=2954806 RepID=UPI0020C459EE|nr:hypothetical protein [Oscillatoria sp. HE19RPO]
MNELNPGATIQLHFFSPIFIPGDQLEPNQRAIANHSRFPVHCSDVFPPSILKIMFFISLPLLYRRFPQV